ncbi:MAG: helix-turn-helix domain-containing protein [Patescibacteria group bacterium]
MPRFNTKKIVVQISFGNTLRQAREQQGFTFKQVSFQTKILESYLRALEDENIKILPAGSYGRHFLREYANYLNLPVEILLKEYDEVQSYMIKGKTAIPPKKTKMRSWFRLSWLVLSILFLTLVVYLGWEARNLFLSPQVELINPPSDIVVNELQIQVKGKTSPGTQITLNGEQVPVSDQGEFSQEVLLQPGLNTITVSAASTYSKPVVITRQVLAQTLPSEDNP